MTLLRASYVMLHMKKPLLPWEEQKNDTGGGAVWSPCTSSLSNRFMTVSTKT